MRCARPPAAPRDGGARGRPWNRWASCGRRSRPPASRGESASLGSRSSGNARGLGLEGGEEERVIPQLRLPLLSPGGDERRHPARGARPPSATRARMRATGASGFSFRSCATPAAEPGVVVPREGDHRGRGTPAAPAREAWHFGRLRSSSAARSTRAVGQGDLRRGKGRVRPRRRATEGCPVPPGSRARWPARDTPAASPRTGAGSTDRPFFASTGTPRPHPSVSAQSTQPRGEPGRAGPVGEGGRCPTRSGRALPEHPLARIQAFPGGPQQLAVGLRRPERLLLALGSRTLA